MDQVQIQLYDGPLNFYPADRVHAKWIQILIGASKSSEAIDIISAMHVKKEEEEEWAVTI